MEARRDQESSARIDRLERFALGAVVAIALILLVVGWVLPWYAEKHDGETTQVRLVTQGFLLFEPPDGTTADAFGVLFCLGFLFLDVITVATVIMLIGLTRRSWRRLRLGAWLIGFDLVCLGVVLLVSAAATGSVGTEVRFAAPVVWGAGVALSTVIYLAPAVRAWWRPRGEVGVDRGIGRMTT